VSQLRQDPATKEWIIIATERMKRPHDFRRAEFTFAQPDFDPNCPFCSSHEMSAPHEVLAYRNSGKADELGWRVRVIPNKFPALQCDGRMQRRVQQDFFREMDGVGSHEVIVETQIHNRFFLTMSQEEAEDVLLAYRDRYLSLREDRRIKLILTFKNHGEGAGTSLAHPHSQLVATPVVPANFR
jgi:UDPglucose--hexose-1-phosphate uridylyltransferase